MGEETVVVFFFFVFFYFVFLGWVYPPPRPGLEAYETGVPPGRSPDAQTFQRQKGRAENGEGVELQIMWSQHR